MKFKVGDIIKGNTDRRYGITNTGMTKGKVIEVSGTGIQDIRIEILEHRDKSNVGDKYWVESAHFDLVGGMTLKETATKLATGAIPVGTKVRVRKDLKYGRYGTELAVDCMLPYAGKEMTISKSAACSGTYRYRLEEDDTDCNWTEEMFEPVTLGISLKPAEQPTPVKYEPKVELKLKFNVGDKVKVVSASCGWAGVSKGEIGTVKKLPEKKGDVYVLSIHGYSSWNAHEADLEPYTESKKEGEPIVAPKFKFGDKVRMISPAPVHSLGNIRLGDTGVVRAVSRTPDSRGRYELWVDFAKQENWHGIEPEFELVKEESLKGISPITQKSGIKFNPVAEIKNVRGKFPYKLSDGRILLDSRDDFKVGDRVKHSTSGEGTVKMIIEQTGDRIGVEFDTWDRGHDFHTIGEEFGYNGKRGHCWFHIPEALKKISGDEGIRLVEKTEVARGITLKTEATPYEYYDEYESEKEYEGYEEDFDEEFDEDFEEETSFTVDLKARGTRVEGIKLVERPVEDSRGIYQTLTTKSERGGIMKAFEKMFGNVSIGKDTSGRLAITPMGMAVKNNEGKWVAYDGTALVDVMDVKFDVDSAFYRIPTLAVAAKDVIINQTGIPVIVVEATKEKIVVVNPYNGLKEEIVPQTNIMGMKFYVKVVNLFGDAFGKMDIAKNPEAMLPFMLMADGGKEDMLPLLLMSGGLGKGTDMNAMLPLLLMSKGGDKSDMLPLLLMSGALGGKPAAGGFNPMLFMLMGDKGGKGDMLETMLLMNAFGGGAGLFGAPAATEAE